MESWIPEIAAQAATYPVGVRAAVLIIYTGCMIFIVRRIFPVD